ncbi:MAG TPA: cell division/cell wall cluster transcriptional repressor MraZ [bacterium]|jgi:MraZ protein
MPIRGKIPFLGHFSGLIDDKGRLSIPADYRHALPEDSGGTIVLTPGSSEFLNVFPLDLFNNVWEQADSNSLGFASDDSLARDTALLSEAVYREIDSQGRITVPQSLLKQAGIGREVVFMGRWNHFVIWDAQAFEAYRTGHKLTAGDAWKTLLDHRQKA